MSVLALFSHNISLLSEQLQGKVRNLVERSEDDSHGLDSTIGEGEQSRKDDRAGSPKFGSDT